MNTGASLLAMLLVVLPVLVASAEEAIPIEQGTVRASGEGTVWALGKGEVEYNLNGVGTLTIFDSSVSRTTLTGQGNHTSDGKIITFTAFKGTIRIEGPSVASRFSDGKVEVRGTGPLSLLLMGEGQYWVNGGPAHNWNKDGALVGVGPPGPVASDKPAADRVVPPPLSASPSATAVVVPPIEIRTVPVYVVEPATALRTTWVYHCDYPIVTVRYSLSTWPWCYRSVSRPIYYGWFYCQSPPPRPRPICPRPRVIVHDRSAPHVTVGPPTGGSLYGGPATGGSLPCGGTVRTGGPPPAGLTGSLPVSGAVHHMPQSPADGGARPGASRLR